MHWITRILRIDMIGETRSDAADAYARELRTYIREKVAHRLPGCDGPFGFQIERIVYTYLDYLLAQGHCPDLERDSKFTFVFRNSVEHFFPQHANRDDLGWDAVGTEDSELNMFGNLALVSVSAN